MRTCKGSILDYFTRRPLDYNSARTSPAMLLAASEAFLATEARLEDRDSAFLAATGIARDTLDAALAVALATFSSTTAALAFITDVAFSILPRSLPNTASLALCETRSAIAGSVPMIRSLAVEARLEAEDMACSAIFGSLPYTASETLLDIRSAIGGSSPMITLLALSLTIEAIEDTVDAAAGA